jgi:hypothetical protein
MGKFLLGKQGVDNMGVTAIIGVASAAGTVGTSIAQSGAEKAQGRYQQEMFNINAQFAELQGRDAIRRGDIEASHIKTGVKKTIGAQRAALAAQGVEIDTGSALEIQEDTRALGEMDAITVRNNAWREAWGYKVEAMNSRGQGKVAMQAAKFNSQQTLAAGGLKAVGQIYSNLPTGSSGGGGETKGGGFAGQPYKSGVYT